MSGKEILSDTNILLYLLSGNDTLAAMLNGKTIHVSFITELELIGFKQMIAAEQRQINSLLNDCVVVSLNQEIKRFYTEIRKASHLKLADAVIAATAMALDIPLITADKQFRTVDDLNLIVYEV